MVSVDAEQLCVCEWFENKRQWLLIKLSLMLILRVTLLLLDGFLCILFQADSYIMAVAISAAMHLILIILLEFVELD